jgi:hypothetical protein
MPTVEEFATARQRAAALFGLHAPDVLFARNVGRLARELRAKATELEGPVNGVRRALDSHASALGLTAQQPAPRLGAARDAADLLARLTTDQDATNTLRALASAAYDISDQELGAAIVSAPAVLAALTETPWQLLDSVRPLAERTDDIGDRARQLLADVTAAATDNEFRRSLVSVLRAIQDTAYPLIRMVLDREPPPPPPRDPPRADTHAGSEQPPDENRVDPPVEPGKTQWGAVHRIRASSAEGELAGEIDAVRAEIRDYATRDPNAEIVIEWRVVTDRSTG